MESNTQFFGHFLETKPETYIKVEIRKRGEKSTYSSQQLLGDSEGSYRSSLSV